MNYNVCIQNCLNDYYDNNLIHYAEDSAANQGGVFMDDYGLC